MEIRKNSEIRPFAFDECHGGTGSLLCASLLDGFESERLAFMHKDDIPAGVSIGYHTHTENEEVYYLFSGKGILTYDENSYEMNEGDISLCRIGHSHAFEATEDCVLIVVGSK